MCVVPPKPEEAGLRLSGNRVTRGPTNHRPVSHCHSGLEVAAVPPRLAPSQVRTLRRLDLCPNRLPVSGPRAEGSLALDQAPEVGSQTVVPPAFSPRKRLLPPPAAPHTKEMSTVYLAVHFSILEAESA